MLVTTAPSISFTVASDPTARRASPTAIVITESLYGHCLGDIFRAKINADTVSTGVTYTKQSLLVYSS